MKKQTLIENINIGLRNEKTVQDHPPRNKIVVKQHIISMFPYSAEKKEANAIALYSTLYPATSSASASGKSNGVLFVSANALIKNTTNSGRSGKINHTLRCAYTMSYQENPPLIIDTHR